MQNPAYVRTEPTASDAVEILVIADRSGSMSSILDDSIGGFNQFLKEQQELPGEATLSLVLFDDKYETPIVNAPIRNVRPLDKTTFVPRGMTALFDAVGKGVNGLLARNPKKAIVVIITDGGENASTEYKAAGVKSAIDSAKARGYETVFLAANQDAFTVGQTMGTQSNHNFAATGAGIRSAYSTATMSATNYRGAPPPTKDSGYVDPAPYVPVDYGSSSDSSCDTSSSSSDSGSSCSSGGD